ncbi:aldehyde dehydrogenase family protein [Streptomyces sp. NPDC056390]|uniref:aldehyde dehydrogenase family protein n=1 Tax=Streptomyces sp. NPDC056390 TaxID=3345806 RepID=UPI0035E14E69
MSNASHCLPRRPRKVRELKAMKHDVIYVDGQWVPSAAAESLEVLNPATGDAIGSVPSGTPADVNRAVSAARAALEAWARTPLTRRAELLNAIAELMEDRRDELIDTVIAEVGTPRTTAVPMQFAAAVHAFRDAANCMADAFEVEQVGNSVVRREPVGVIGAITPWNFPLYQIALKVAPALAAGCTVVLKPSEVAGLSPYLLAEIIDEVGLPAGVFNMVSGTGPVVGEAISTHPDVDMVSFTGSDRAGRRIAEAAAQTVKKVALELGGKSAAVLLDDADFEVAVPATVSHCFTNAGQVCAALTRLVVPRSKLAVVEELAVSAAAKFTAGAPNSSETTLGPVISAHQRDRVNELIASGTREGARHLTVDTQLPEELNGGFYVAPTIFSQVAPDARIAQEEIFGPVLAIIPVDSEDAAVAVANGTRYGLNGSVWSRDIARAERVAARLNAGTVYINSAKFNPSAPFGGTKGSGYGRERGRYGVDEYLRLKAYQY